MGWSCKIAASSGRQINYEKKMKQKLFRAQQEMSDNIVKVNSIKKLRSP